MKRLFCLPLLLLLLFPSAARDSGGERLFPRKGTGAVRIVSYNVGVFTKSGSDRMAMVADMLSEMQADAAGIQELDSCAARTGGVFQLRALAERLGWRYRFARAIPFDGGAYGIGILSKRRYRILDSWSMTLDRESGSEQRALNVVEFPRFVLATTHLDHVGDTARLHQAMTISDTLSARYGTAGKTVVLCGDFNAGPDSPILREMEKRWEVVSPPDFTYDSSQPRVRIDYIMVLENGSRWELLRSAVPVRFGTGDVKVASDHLPVYADIRPERARSRRP